MATYKKTILLFLLYFSTLCGANKYPIILIHGFLGWGKEELGEQEIKWGPVYGSTDVQQPEEIIQFCPVNTITDVLEKHFTDTHN